MIVVLDASAGIRAVFDPRPPKPVLRSLANADLVLAPQSYIAETANALIKYVRMHHLSLDMAKDAHAKALALVNNFHAHQELIAEAIDLAAKAGSVYDALYLVLARRHGATLLTADAALAASARKLRIRMPS